MSEFNSGSEIRSNNLEQVKNDSTLNKDKKLLPLASVGPLGLTEKGLAALQDQPLTEENIDIVSALSSDGLAALQDEDLSQDSK